MSRRVEIAKATKRVSPPPKRASCYPRPLIGALAIVKPSTTHTTVVALENRVKRAKTGQHFIAYLGNVHAAGGFAKYGQARRAPFVAMLDRGSSLPRDAISVVCEFWLRAGEYYRSPQPPGGVNSNNNGSDPTPMHEATKENLLALIAESDDDEPAPAPARPAKKPRYFEDVEPEDNADEDA